jgi:hypothetical protein
MKPDGYVGVDVAAGRSAYAVVRGDLSPHRSGWLEEAAGIRKIVEQASADLGRVAVGIDAPRAPLPAPRSHYWRRKQWVPKGPFEKGRGRHCEVVLKAWKIANPQWTPQETEAEDWMRVGFAMYRLPEGDADVHEVFPTASYRLLETADDAVCPLSLSQFAGGPKDMLDAYVAAFTVREFLEGRGAEVGGGDGLGTIVLPRPLPATAPPLVLDWPGSH